MTYDIKQLRQWSGTTKAQRIKYEVPIIKFSGRDGTFKKFEIGSDRNDPGEDLPTSFDVTILRARRVLSSFQVENGENIRMFSNEHNTWQDPITLWKAEKGSIKTEATGVIEELRKEYTELDLRNNLYCLYGGEVHKLQVRGKARRNFTDYLKKLGESNTDIFTKSTKLEAISEKNPSGMAYFTINYEAIADVSLETVGPFVQEVGEKMDAIDEQYKSYNDSKKQTDTSEPAEDTDTPQSETQPEEQAEQSGTEDIKVENIPF